jgi:hypothetical protein
MWPSHRTESDTGGATGKGGDDHDGRDGYREGEAGSLAGHCESSVSRNTILMAALDTVQLMRA